MTTWVWFCAAALGLAIAATFLLWRTFAWARESEPEKGVLNARTLSRFSRNVVIRWVDPLFMIDDRFRTKRQLSRPGGWATLCIGRFVFVAAKTKRRGRTILLVSLAEQFDEFVESCKTITDPPMT